MATRAETVEAILEAAADRDAHARKMFGEYALYHRAKVVALVCDDELFLKPTAPGRAMLASLAGAEPEEAPPYPGARAHLKVGGDLWEREGVLGPLLAATADALPEPKPRRPRGAKAK